MQIKKDRKYLMYLEKKGEGRIKWDVWDKMVNQTKNEIDEYFRNHTPVKKEHQGINIYAYDNNGNLINTFNSNTECAQHFKGNECTVHHYSINQNIYNGYLLSREELTKDRAFAMYRFALEHGKIFQPFLKNTKPKKTVYLYNQFGRMTGIYESLIVYCHSVGSTSLSSLRKRLVKGDIITKGKLMSYSFYDEYTAIEQYKAVICKSTKPMLTCNIYKDGELVNSNVKVSDITGIVNISESTIRKKFKIRPYFYWLGYVISKVSLTRSKALQIADNKKLIE